MLKDMFHYFDKDLDNTDRELNHIDDQIDSMDKYKMVFHFHLINLDNLVYIKNFVEQKPFSHISSNIEQFSPLKLEGQRHI